jgi:hypothetical protein
LYTTKYRVGARRFTQRATALFAAAMMIMSAAPRSMADDASALIHDLSSGADFRLRVDAALSLGRMKSAEGYAPLVGALDDAHPAVRAAAAAALAALGRREAIEPIRAHLAHEPAPSVQSQLRAAADKLSPPVAIAEAPRRKAKVFVKVGQLRNVTTSRGPEVTEIFRGATRAKAAELPGVELLGDDAESNAQAAARKLPVLVLDGVVNRLAQGAAGERPSVSAQVEFTFRKIPEHSLRGTVTGIARAEGDSPRGRQRMSDLESQALCGAVESAMRGAPQVMLAALK